MEGRVEDYPEGEPDLFPEETKIMLGRGLGWW